jgi:hypothetical protein
VASSLSRRRGVYCLTTKVTKVTKKFLGTAFRVTRHAVPIDPPLRPFVTFVPLVVRQFRSGASARKPVGPRRRARMTASPQRPPRSRRGTKKILWEPRSQSPVTRFQKNPPWFPFVTFVPLVVRLFRSAAAARKPVGSRRRARDDCFTTKATKVTKGHEENSLGTAFAVTRHTVPKESPLVPLRDLRALGGEAVQERSRRAKARRAPTPGEG